MLYDPNVYSWSEVSCKFLRLKQDQCRSRSGPSLVAKALGSVFCSIAQTLNTYVCWSREHSGQIVHWSLYRDLIPNVCLMRPRQNLIGLRTLTGESDYWHGVCIIRLIPAIISSVVSICARHLLRHSLRGTVRVTTQLRRHKTRYLIKVYTVCFEKNR